MFLFGRLDKLLEIVATLGYYFSPGDFSVKGLLFLSGEFLVIHQVGL